jgi:hypothetical protein
MVASTSSTKLLFDLHRAPSTAKTISFLFSGHIASSFLGNVLRWHQDPTSRHIQWLHDISPFCQKKLKWQMVPAINSNAALVEVSEKMTGYCIAVPWSIHLPTILTSDIFPSMSRTVQACPACPASHDVEVMAKLSLEETHSSGHEVHRNTQQ